MHSDSGRENLRLQLPVVVSVSGLLLALLLLTGCALDTPVAEAPVAPSDMGKADLHQLKSEELRRLMQSMNMTLFEPEVTALDVDEQRLRQARGIAVLLGMITDELVALAEGELQLSPAERPLFSAYANELRGHASRFEEIAESGAAEEFMPALRETVTTCNACHDRFRDM